VLTGAVWASHRTQDFRSDAGIGTRSRSRAREPAGFESDPALLDLYNERFAAYATANRMRDTAPSSRSSNACAAFLATQNVDGLQARAGSRGGRTPRRSADGALQGCAYREPLAARSTWRASRTIAAASCGPTRVVRRIVAADAWELAERASSAADVIIVAGTSLAVHPAASLARVGDAA